MLATLHPPNRRVIASGLGNPVNNSSADDSAEERILEDTRRETARMRRQIEDIQQEASDAEAMSHQVAATQSATPKTNKKADPSKKKKLGLPVHPLAGLVQRDGALSPDASVASILTFGCCGFHASAADHITRGSATRGTVVWEFGESRNCQIVYRDMTIEELDNIPITPNEEKPEKRDEREEEIEKSNEEESDD